MYANNDDGASQAVLVDSEGRLKVSSKPANYPEITGDITAVQAAISTPVAGGTVEGDVSRASNVMAFCTGAFSGVNVTFEGSLETSGDTNWFGLQAVRSNANTVETATGALSAQPVYGWELSVNALKRIRVRCTARTSGTQSWRFVQGTYATEPIPASQATANQPVTATPLTPTAGSVVTTASTNAAVVKSTAGNLFNVSASNPTATPAYVKLYGKATAPTVGTDIPLITIPVPANSAVSFDLGSLGARFGSGIGRAVTGAIGATDTTNAVAGVQVLISYV